MRPYPVNSPEAAARILAMTLLADGRLSEVEVDLMDRMLAHERLGMSRSALQGVLHTCSRDLAQMAHLNWTEACALDPWTLQQVLAEVSDAELQRQVLALAVAAVEADEHVSEGERTLLTAAAEHWGLQRMLLQPSASNPAWAMAV
jgi:hypothetical protein